MQRALGSRLMENDAQGLQAHASVFVPQTRPHGMSAMLPQYQMPAIVRFFLNC